MATTARAIMERVARLAFAGMGPIKSTATSGGASTWIDSGVVTGKSSTSAFAGWDIHVISDAGGAGAAPEDQERTVTATGYAVASGTFTVSAAWTTNNPASGDIALFYPLGFTKDDMYEAINDILRNLPLERYIAATAITDGDMEASGTTNYTDAVGTPTQTKETTEVLTGTQSLKLVIANLDDAVQTASVPVTENDQVLVWAPIKCTAGSLRMSVWDVTAGAEISGMGVTVDEEAWTVPVFQVSVPANCQNIAIRFVAKTAATTAYVDHAGLLYRRENLYNLPSVIENAEQVELFYLPQGRASEANNAYIWTGELEPWPDPVGWRDYLGVTAQRALFCAGAYPLFYKFRALNSIISLPSTSVVTDDTDVIEAIVEGAAANVYGRLANGATDRSKQVEFLGKEQIHRSTYHALLRSANIAQPVARYSPPPRVSTRSRYWG